MLRRPFFPLAVFGLLAAANTAAWMELLGRPVGLPLPLHPWPLAAGSAAAAALLACMALPKATLAARLTVAVFFLALSGMVPAGGILLTGALAFILGRPSQGGVRPEEDYLFGNPTAAAARRESREPAPHLIPLAESVHSMDTDSLCRVIRGLKDTGPGTAPILRRFQQDGRTSVQFAAQAVLAGAAEELEETLKVLKKRCAASPEDAESRLAAADVLIRSAAWAPPGDATAGIQLRDAEALLREILALDPDHPQALLRLSRLQLAACDGAAAQRTITRYATLADSMDPEALSAVQESLYHQGRWAELSDFTRQIRPAPGMAESHAFWAAPPHG